MTKPYILNQYERAALLALSQRDQTPAHGEAARSFGKAHLDVLLGFGLAALVPSKSDAKSNGFRITDEGWRCMYGLTKTQIDSDTNGKPAPFRVWQWPVATATKIAA